MAIKSIHIFTANSLFVPSYTKRKSPFWNQIFHCNLVCFSCNHSLLNSNFSLPKPKGESFVGTETFHWVDSSRQEWFTEENVNDFREIMVQFWYPSADNQNKEVEPYMDFIELRSKTIAEAGNLPSFLPSHLNLVKTNSYSKIACKTQKGAFLL